MDQSTQPFPTSSLFGLMNWGSVISVLKEATDRDAQSGQDAEERDNFINFTPIPETEIILNPNLLSTDEMNIEN